MIFFFLLEITVYILEVMRQFSEELGEFANDFQREAVIRNEAVA